MNLYTKFVNWILWKFVLLLKKKTYIIYTGGTKYLLRVYLKTRGVLPEVFLHRFYASDTDRDPHSHPFKKSYSLILSGSYQEARLNKDMKTKTYHLYEAGDINVIQADDYHQVEMVSSPIWTLFIAGKRIKSWGFWDIEKQKYIPWQEYTEQNNNFVVDLDGNLTKLPE